jgi:hypothetical protein
MAVRYARLDILSRRVRRSSFKFTQSTLTDHQRREGFVAARVADLCDFSDIPCGDTLLPAGTSFARRTTYQPA